MPKLRPDRKKPKLKKTDFTLVIDVRDTPATGEARLRHASKIGKIKDVVGGKISLESGTDVFDEDGTASVKTNKKRLLRLTQAQQNSLFQSKLLGAQNKIVNVVLDDSTLDRLDVQNEVP